MLDADLAWTHARYAADNANDDIGNRIPNAVDNVSSFRIAVHDVRAWSSDLKMLYIGGYPLSPDAGLHAPSSLVTHLRLQRQLTPDISLSLDVLNLLDRNYFRDCSRHRHQSGGARRHHRASGRAAAVSTDPALAAVTYQIRTDG